MTNKTPYELRFDLLKLAKETLEAEYHSTMESVRWQHEHHIIGSTRPKIPEFPNKDKIFNLADEYKVFIEQK